MFSKDTYISRRLMLKKLVGDGIIVLFGNNEAPANYPANAYAPMRQDSSFLYYFGQHRDGLVGVIDIDNDTEMLFGDDIDVEDIVWMGYTPSVADLAAEVGITKTAPMKDLRHLHTIASHPDHPLPAALSFRHEDPDHGPAGHPSFTAEGERLTRSYQGRCEDACNQESRRRLRLSKMPAMWVMRCTPQPSCSSSRALPSASSVDRLTVSPAVWLRV